MGLFKTVAQKIESGANWIEKTGVAAVDTTIDAGKQAFVSTKNKAIEAYETTKETAVWTKDKVVETAVWTKDKVVETAVWTKDKVVETAVWTKDKVVETAVWTKDKVVEAAVWTKDKAIAGIEKAIDISISAYQLGKKALQALQDGTKAVGNFTIDELAGAIAILIAGAATANKPVEGCLQGLLDSFNPTAPSPEELEKAEKADGKYMGPDCPKTSEKPPSQGRLPSGCEQCADKAKKLPKILYVNGINTDPKTACATITAIANTRCAEVTGVYNATKGLVTDLLDCKNNIDRAGQEPAAHTQAAYLVDMLSKDPPEPVTIYAHSQGGLITQEGIGEAQKEILATEKARLMAENKNRAARGQEPYTSEELKALAAQRTEARMSQVTVYSFGTAVYDWPPVGAHLHQFTNLSDPVPKVITSVQMTRGKVTDELERIKTNKKPTNSLDESQIFVKPTLNPIDAHSMDNVYLPQLEKRHPTPKKANGSCC